MALKTTIADHMRILREASGLSQEKLAMQAGISVRYYQSIEAGHYTPSVETIFKLAKALGVDYTILLNPLWEVWLKTESTSDND